MNQPHRLQRLRHRLAQWGRKTVHWPENAPSPSHALLWRVLAGIGLIAAVLVAGTWYSLSASRTHYLQRGVDAAATQARGLSYELGTEMRLIDNALATIAHAFIKHSESQAMLQEMLLTQSALLPFVHTVRMADSGGVVRLGLRPGESTYSIARYDFFQDVMRSDKMVISEPLLSEPLQGWSIVLARRLDRQDGSFHGIVFITLGVEHFRRMFAQVTQGEDGAISLRSGTGRLIARYSGAEPLSTQGTGGTVMSQALAERLQRSPEKGWYITPTALDGIDRITAYQQLAPDYAMTVLTGISTESYLAPWRREALVAWALTLTSIVLLIAGAAALFLRQQRERAAKLQNARLLQEQRFFVENDLIGMLKVRDGRIQWANHAMARMLGQHLPSIMGRSLRQLYPDDTSFDRMHAESEHALQAHHRFRSEVQLQHSSGSLFWVDANAARIPPADAVWVFVDVDAHKRRQEQAEHQATHDTLTGLANRRLLMHEIQRCMALARRGQMAAVCFIDLDGFKDINDRYGHEAGDVVLQTVAERLSATVRGHDCVARLGGDEFVLVLSGPVDRPQTVQTMQRCLEALRASMHLPEGQTVSLGCSIGIAYTSAGLETPQALLRRADMAMYQAKRRGSGSIVESEESTGLGPGH